MEEWMKKSTRLYYAAIWGVLFMAVVMFGSRAYAAEQNPCSEDIEKFCKNVGPGPALLGCLEEHESQLSDKCKDYEIKMEGPRGESREFVRQQMRIRQACRSDVEKFCSDVKPGSYSVGLCLTSHLDELSEPCGQAVKAARTPDEGVKTK
jgi:hypothetical protein